MYSTKSGLILGFHGCDESVVEKVLKGNDDLITSKNEYDWLGNGIYFWENSAERAYDFAKELKNNRRNKSIKNPSVIGAVIDLGYCLDLIDFSNIQLLKKGYDILEQSYLQNNWVLPQNISAANSSDLLIRKLDCKVIETIHQGMENKKPFDSVRAVFWEGREIYKNAGFKEKNHIQICVRNPNCIKGYFLPKPLNEKWDRV
jgi:hypothetical protein